MSRSYRGSLRVDALRHQEDEQRAAAEGNRGGHRSCRAPGSPPRCAADDKTRRRPNRHRARRNCSRCVTAPGCSEVPHGRTRPPKKYLHRVRVLLVRAQIRAPCARALPIPAIHNESVHLADPPVISSPFQPSFGVVCVSIY